MTAAEPIGGGSSAFDGLATDYDEEFTNSPLGRVLRDAVWRRITPYMRPGGRALDLGCGSGVDALRLAGEGMEVVAVDASQEMIDLARNRPRREGLAVRFEHGDLRRLDGINGCSGPFDLVLSNFGALNCVGDLTSVLEAAAVRLSDRGVAIAVIMGRVVPWEMIWMLVNLRPAAALRRLRRGGVRWRGSTVRYYSPGSVRHSARLAGLRVTRLAGLGVLLPVTEAGPWIAHHLRLLTVLDRCERALEAVPPAPWLADHMVVEMGKAAEI